MSDPEFQSDRLASSPSQSMLRLAARCGVCGGTLVERRVGDWPLTAQADFTTGVESPWETIPGRPPGASALPDAMALACVSADCRRIYLVWDQVPNLLLQEAGVLSPTAFAAD
jgi:uncharacterized protein YbaR (Trm112 family)